MYKFRIQMGRVLILALLISSIIMVNGTVFQSVAQSAPIKIMPVGDSCTAGMGDPSYGGYRTDLYQHYKNAGLNVEFVGSQTGGPSSLPQRNHEGHSGWTIPQISSNIDKWLNTYNPDVVLLWIGGNDIFFGGGINTSGLSSLIDQILRFKPDITIFVADYYPVPEQVKQYNATIPGVVQQKANAGKNVYFVKLSDINLVHSTDISSDNLHLSPTGYSKVATIWFNSTIDILKSLAGGTPVEPTSPPKTPPAPTTTPNPITSGPIKIMPVGDSCTAGMGDPSYGGYRTDLYKHYTNAGLNFQFVGSQTGGPSSLPQRNHEGHSGWTIPQISSNIDKWLNTYNPDVVLLWIGGNDIFFGGGINTSGLSSLIDQILRFKPDITIFVADYYPVPEQVKQYNATIPGVVQQKANAGKNVYFVKLSDINLVHSTDISSDNLHLSPTGYSKVATIWFNSTIDILKSLAGGTPGEPTSPPETPAPERSAFSKIEAEEYNSKTSSTMEEINTASGKGIGYIESGDSLTFKNINFGSGATKFSAYVASGINVPTNIEIRLNSSTGTRLGTLEVSSTGDWNDYTELSTSISQVTGKNDIVLVFSGPVNIDWFVFSAADPSTPPPSSVKYGDLNDNGVIDSNDYILLSRYILEITPSLDNPTAADLNGDGLINTLDLSLLQRYILEIISSFPVEN
jgi:lysophospholipase L1-like esterase